MARLRLMFIIGTACFKAAPQSSHRRAVESDRRISRKLPFCGMNGCGVRRACNVPPAAVHWCGRSWSFCEGPADGVLVKTPSLLAEDEVERYAVYRG